MQIKNIMWLIALFLTLIIVSGRQEEKKNGPKDGSYENCYLISLKDDRADVLIGDRIWTIDCVLGKEKEKKDQIVDITVEKNKISKITWKEGKIKDSAEAVNMEEGWIRLKERGKKELSPQARIYLKREDEINVMEQAGSLLNFPEISLYLYEDVIHAVVAEGDGERETIKVLLHGEKDGIYHEEIRITASEPYTVKNGKKKETYDPGEEIFIKEKSGQWEISCEKGKLRLLSGTKSREYPEYRGIFRVTAEEQGYILVNELPLEEYLYSVISSEMPSSYPLEALKAQAVCARTYALYQMEQSYYSPYGAHVDDTVNSQVYNNTAETRESKGACEETKGEYLTYKEEPIAAYFYSTSCGTSSDVTDVWLSNKTCPVYLKGKIQGEEKETKDLSKEETFRSFIDNSQEGFFEEEEPWYRWETAVDVQELGRHIDHKKEEWERKKPQYYSYEGEKEMGSVEEVKILKRSSGGVIEELEVEGEKGSLTVLGEYQIRQVLCLSGTEILLQNGKKKSSSMLPSGYFYPEMEKDVILLKGGGYGHGVGLSQNGAKAMAEKEYSYQEILSFYYPETELFQKY